MRIGRQAKRQAAVEELRAEFDAAGFDLPERLAAAAILEALMPLSHSARVRVLNAALETRR